MIMKLVMVNPGRSHTGQYTQQIMLSQTLMKTCAVCVLNRTSTMSLNNPAETGLTVPVVAGFMKSVLRITRLTALAKIGFVIIVWIFLIDFVWCWLPKVACVFVCAPSSCFWYKIYSIKLVPQCRAAKAACSGVACKGTESKAFVRERKFLGGSIIENELLYVRSVIDTGGR